jgi:hypothetical protein
MKPTQHFVVNSEFVRTSILKALGGLSLSRWAKTEYHYAPKSFNSQRRSHS